MLPPPPSSVQGPPRRPSALSGGLPVAILGNAQLIPGSLCPRLVCAATECECWRGGAAPGLLLTLRFAFPSQVPAHCAASSRVRRKETPGQQAGVGSHFIA